MKDMVSSISVGIVNGKVAVDLTKEEEDLEGAVDIPIAILPRKGEITLLQLDGLIDRKLLNEALQVGIASCRKIYELQKNALKERYLQ